MSRPELEGAAAASFALLAFFLVCLATVWLLGGCAYGGINPVTGEVHGFAIGDSKLEWCSPRPNPAPGFLEGLAHGQPEECSRIVGGPIIPAIVDSVFAVVKGGLGFLTGGATWLWGLL